MNFSVIFQSFSSVNEKQAMVTLLVKAVGNGKSTYVVSKQSNACNNFNFFVGLYFLFSIFS